MPRRCGASSIDVAAFFAVLLTAAGNVTHLHETSQTSLLQRDVTVYSRGTGWLDNGKCTSLKNEGSYFSVKLCVGTPEQCFEVVADTGSNAVIVPSCICLETKGAGCSDNVNCFRGTNKSSTFSVSRPVRAIRLTFGSGSIVTAIATDLVRVGDLSVTMEDGVLLMLDRAHLEIEGDFQGILGLGSPGNGDGPFLFQQAVPFNQFKEESWSNATSVPISARLRHGAQQTGDSVAYYKEKLILEQANVARFSICFSDAERPGAMRFGLPPFQSPLRNIGKLHWGLGFHGLAVGSQGGPPSEMIFCGPGAMKPGMDTPCGIIPDSGTTFIRGPKDQVATLEKSLCSKWPRCQHASFGRPSSSAFRSLLRLCRNWLTEEKGLLEIPSFFFYVKNGEGISQAFELTAWAWVTESIYGCHPMIEAMHNAYKTGKNGPIWIFGTPLFFEYDVGYDLPSNQINLKQGKCEPCSGHGGPVSLNDGGLRRWPRTAYGKPRAPHYNVNLPL